MSKPQILHGVPYIVNELFQASAYTMGSTTVPAPVFGTVTTETSGSKGIQLLPDWQLKAQAYLAEYRASLRAKTEASLERLM